MHSDAGPCNNGVSKYVVQSTDVLQDMRVNVCEEHSDKVIWFKERFLNDEEIVENFIHNPTNTVQWTIHRPLRGWYIRLRSPSFPPGVFIPFIPVPSTSALHTDAAIAFHTRTNSSIATSQLGPSESKISLQDNESVTSSSASVHSYPPTPSALVTPLTPSKQGLFDIQSSSKTPLQPPREVASQITQFLLSPSSIQPVHHQPENASFFSRAISLLKTHRPSHSSSFTLSRIISPSNITQPPPYTSTVSIAGPSTPEISKQLQPHLHTPPLLVFHDRTPLYTVRSLTGLIEIDKAEEISLAVDTGFWIAIALTYLEFLEERESYLAAND